MQRVDNKNNTKATARKQCCPVYVDLSVQRVGGGVVACPLLPRADAFIRLRNETVLQRVPIVLPSLRPLTYLDKSNFSPHIVGASLARVCRTAFAPPPNLLFQRSWALSGYAKTGTHRSWGLFWQAETNSRCSCSDYRSGRYAGKCCYFGSFQRERGPQPRKGV